MNPLIRSINRLLQIFVLTLFVFIGIFTSKSFAVFDEYTHPDIQRIKSKLIEVDGKLYGTSAQGGDYGYGTIFSFDPETETFTILKSFNNNEGETPVAALSYYNNKLYSVASYGGANNSGSLFSINLDGSGYTQLYDFTNAEPQVDDLVIVNDKFYGTAAAGGTNNLGQIFSINPDGTGYTTLHSFAGGLSDGDTPWSGLTYANNKLYGNTHDGGTNDKGVIFSIDLDGTDYAVIAHFSAGFGQPESKMIEHEGTLYGSLITNGDYGTGALYKIDVDGTDFTEFSSFDCNVADSLCYPEGSFLVINDLFYGLSSYGENGYATIYTFDMNTNTATVLDEFKYDNIFYPYWHTGLIEFGGKLWGTADNGGPTDDGGIFAYTLPDTSAPVIQSISPTSGSNISDKTPTLTITLDEVGSCRASFTDESYADMADNVDCSGDNSTNISCNMPSLGNDGQKTIFVSCIDGIGNSNNQSNNTLLTLNLETEDNSSTPVSSSDPTPSSGSQEGTSENDNEVDEDPDKSIGGNIEIVVTDDKNNPLQNTKLLINGKEYTTDSNGKLILSKDIADSNPTIKIIVNGKEIAGALTNGTISYSTQSQPEVVDNNVNNNGDDKKEMPPIFMWGIILLILISLIIYIYLNSKNRE